MQLFDWFHTYQSRRWQRRALAAEAREAILRRDLERALERYHEMLDERNRLLKRLDEPNTLLKARNSKYESD